MAVLFLLFGFGKYGDEFEHILLNCKCVGICKSVAVACNVRICSSLCGYLRLVSSVYA